MEINHNKQTEMSSAQKEVVASEVINSLDLVMEINLLLNDYFNGSFLQNDSGILMKMNGQTFQLTVTEVV